MCGLFEPRTEALATLMVTSKGLDPTTVDSDGDGFSKDLYADEPRLKGIHNGRAEQQRF